MSLKFRLKGLAETFIDEIRCPSCGHDGGKEGDQGFKTDHTRVTYDGIVVVVECEHCMEIFIPATQRLGILDVEKLRTAVAKDSVKTGLPLYETLRHVQLDVERMKALKNSGIH